MFLNAATATHYRQLTNSHPVPSLQDSIDYRIAYIPVKNAVTVSVIFSALRIPLTTAAPSAPAANTC
jgi:hypothetical protein